MEKFKAWLLVCEIVTLTVLYLDYMRFKIMIRKMESKKDGKGNEKQQQGKEDERRS